MLVGTGFIFSGIVLTPVQVQQMKAAGTYTPFLQHETMRVVKPYLVLGAVVAFWALLILRTTFPKLGEEREPAATRESGSYRDLLRYPHFIQAVIAQFFYVGAQVGTWSFFIQYIQDYTRQPEKVAGYFLTGTLVAFTVGRFVAISFASSFCRSGERGAHEKGGVEGDGVGRFRRRHLVPIPEVDSLAELRRCCGTQFDPDVVHALSAVIAGRAVRVS